MVALEWGSCAAQPAESGRAGLLLLCPSGPREGISVSAATLNLKAARREPVSKGHGAECPGTGDWAGRPWRGGVSGTASPRLHIPPPAVKPAACPTEPACTA